MDRYKPYPDYKDSGVEWLGQIPAHWDVAPALAYLEAIGRPVSPTAIKSDDVFLYSIPSVQTFDDGEVVALDTVDSGKVLIEKTCLLVSKLNPRKGTIITAYPKQIPTLASTEFVALAPKPNCDLKYAEYVYRSEFVRQYLDSTVESATRSHQRTKPNLIYKIKWGWPPLPEQRAIAAFLDRETAHIDALIAKKRELIALLQRQRAAVISHAVTKGLDPSVPLKDSGVEWLGQIPAHWDVLPLRRVSKRIKTGSTPAGARISAFQEDGWNWFTPSDFSDSIILEKSSRRLSHEGINEVPIFPEDTVYLVGIGATIGKVGISSRTGSCNQQIHGIVVGKSVDPKFIAYILSTRRDFIVKCGKYTTLPIINQDETKSLIIVRPPIKEQRAIAEYLDSETARIDGLIQKIEESIDLLQRQRTALISAAVTGKIDVREQV